MQRLITLVSSLVAVSLIAVGCGSDGNSGTPNAGGSGGSAGSNSVTQCVGHYSDLTETVFAANATAGGMCVNPGDLGSICINDLTTIAGTCGIACLTSVAQDAATQNACVSSCLDSKVAPALGGDCRDCYVTDVQCARDKCQLDCLSPSSAKCDACRQAKGCAPAFYSCTGLPVPGSVVGIGAGGADTGAGGI